jgi:hypothetical protein
MSSCASHRPRRGRCGECLRGGQWQQQNSQNYSCGKGNHVRCSALGSADGTGTAAQFYGPFGVAVDHSGNVFVTDTGNNTIRKVTPARVVTTLGGLALSPGGRGNRRTL